jgi:uncharacterized protein (TIGR03790 family)
MMSRLWAAQAASLLEPAPGWLASDLNRTLSIVTLAFLSAVLLTPSAQADESLAAATVVVYNKAISESGALAHFYAQKRNIPRDHVVGLDCPIEEEIARERYDSTIAEPLRAQFLKRHWWVPRHEDEPERGLTSSSIHFLVLMKGMPLKIKPALDYPGDTPAPGPMGNRNEASVDSELAVLGRFSTAVSGPQQNPYYESFLSVGDLGEPGLLLVCRLDAPSSATVRRMITDAIATEKSGLWGRAYLDEARNPAAGFELGDKWLSDIRAQLHRVGVPVVTEDTAAVFPKGYPMSNCALYYGWYAGGVSGPFAQPEFEFVPGAIAVHIHSFSAATLRDANANWVGPLLMRGAAASLGNVYEPYLQLTANLNTFNDRLLHGFTLAESAYMSMRALSWMPVVVGDPLYRPYHSWTKFPSKEESSKNASVWEAYHRFALANMDKTPNEYRKVARDFASRTGNGPMIEDLGLMEMAEGDYARATNYFQQARSIYSKRDDLLRSVLEEANAWIKDDNPKRALALLRNVLRALPDSSSAALLRQLEQQLAPPPPAPPTAAPTP